MIWRICATMERGGGKQGHASSAHGALIASFAMAFAAAGAALLAFSAMAIASAGAALLAFSTVATSAAVAAPLALAALIPSATVRSSVFLCLYIVSGVSGKGGRASAGSTTPSHAANNARKLRARIREMSARRVCSACNVGLQNTICGMNGRESQ
jgi:hypothetical protein